jgi:hypothetical protein
MKRNISSTPDFQIGTFYSTIMTKTKDPEIIKKNNNENSLSKESLH